MSIGAFGENFPYSNFHDLNMDWIIKIAKDFLDQYSHIQELIENGETSIDNATSEGLEQLADKADELETLLQEWYNTHSEDIALELANAIAEFNTSADNKAALTIQSIPSDYSDFYKIALKNFIALPDNTDLNDVEGNSIYLLSAPSYSYDHSPLPTGVAGVITNYEINEHIAIQVVYSMQSSANMWIRSKISDNWFAWSTMKIPELYTGHGIIPDNTDFDTLTTPGTYLFQSGHTYTNAPFSSDYGGVLIVAPDSVSGYGDIVQLAYTYSDTNNNMAKYRLALNGTFQSAWIGYELFRTRTLLGEGADFDLILNPGVYHFDSGLTYSNAPFPAGYGGALIVFPNSIAGSNVQMAISYSSTGDNKIRVRMSLNNVFPAVWCEVGDTGKHGIIPDNTDFDTITTEGTYFFQSGYTYTHAPFSNSFGGILIVSKDSVTGYNNILQEAYTYSATGDNKAKYRVSLNGVFPSAWAEYEQFRSRIQLGSGADFNLITTPGLYYFNSHTNYSHAPFSTSFGGTLIVYPNSIDGSIVQMAISYSPNGNNRIKLRMSLNGEFPSEWGEAGGNQSQGIIPNNTDFDTLTTPGSYSFQSGYTYVNAPFSTEYGGILIVSPDSVTDTNNVVQQAFTYSPTGNNYTKYRVSLNGAFPSTWAVYDIFRSRILIGNGADFDYIKTPGIYFFNSGYEYTNAPFSSSYGGTLIVFPNSINGCYVQMAISYSVTGESRTKVRMSLNDTYPPIWSEPSGSGTTYNNYYQSQHYDNTYNIACSPTITADTNNYLASTGDQTDRSADIQAILSTNNTCHLGPGLFMISGVEIPAYKSVIGSGRYTTVRLLPSVTSGYAFKMNDQTTVSDMRISGGTTSPTIESTVGTRHGILFEGTKISGQTGGVTRKKASVYNVMISNFTGGGVACTGTGVDIDSNMLINNCFIDHCNAGIYIPYYSEYHKFTNCAVTYCYYGCYNNGGNNIFANCDFSGNRVGIYIDNSTNQSPNNTHGVYTGCSVNHSYSEAGVINEGVAIKILGAKNGEIFNSMQIHYGAIIIDDCNGMRFSNCQFGKLIVATITDSTVVTFTDCTMASTSDFSLTKSGNTILVFRDCYTLGGTPITY